MKNLIFNPFRIYLIFNITVFFFYLLQLSELYKPSLEFIGYYISILLFFSIISFKFFFSHKKYLNNIPQVLQINNEIQYIWITIFLFIIGFIANIYQILNYGIPLLVENKVDRIIGNHYIQYLVNFMMMSSIMAYIGFRTFHKKIKFVMLLILIFSIGSLAVWLNRGAFTLLFLTILIYEYSFAIVNKIQKKFYLILIGLIIIFFGIFNYVGNLRVEYVMEHIFKYTINDHYQMNNIFPSWFVWIYIYLTSPLENINQILLYQSISEYRYGMQLFYPFVAPIAKNIFDPITLYPPLDNEAGLNVSTFLVDAISDFGYIGPYIYMIFLICFLRIAQISMKRGIYGFLAYISAINIALWMVFVNSFAVGPFMIAYIFYIFMAWHNSFKI